MLDKIGQLFITGFDTPEPSKEFLDFFSRENIGGLILFENNCNPHHMAEKSIKDIIGTLSDSPPLIGVDQEGGRVCRFRGAPAEYGSPGEYGRKNDLELFNEQFSRAAYYIHSLGVNLLFGPVADFRLGLDNECLKGRTFGKSAASIIPFIEASVKICRKAGLLSCLKHFPGFGAARNDPHKQIALADYDYQTFLNREAVTFLAGIEAGADMVMSTHMIISKLDQRLATESKIIIEQLLRDKLKFDGIIITDDLLMNGAHDLGSYGERAVKAFKAGHDLLLFGKNYRAAQESIAYFKAEFRRGNIEEERLIASLDRISGIKSRLTMLVP
jgi:beta-N-acetylhexosaminidase